MKNEQLKCNVRKLRSTKAKYKTLALREKSGKQDDKETTKSKSIVAKKNYELEKYIHTFFGKIVRRIFFFRQMTWVV